MNELHQASAAAAASGAAANLATNAQQKPGVIRSLKSNVAAPTSDAGSMGQLSTEAAVAIAQLNELAAPKVPTGQRRIIKKITIIDPKKLQQAGLDRQIAEILSKQKLAAKQGTSNKSTPTAKLPTVKNAPTQSQPPDPKITASTSQERGLDKLSPVDRLKHAKKLLNQKLLTRASTSPTSALPISPKTTKLPVLDKNTTTKSLGAQNPAPKTKQYLVLKVPPEEPSAQKRSTKKTPQPKSWPVKSPPKTPQEIARVLDFSGQSSAEKSPVKSPQFIHNFNLAKLTSSTQQQRHPQQQKQENCLKSYENVLHTTSHAQTCVRSADQFHKTYEKKSTPTVNTSSQTLVSTENDDVIPKASIRKLVESSSSDPRTQPPSQLSFSSTSPCLDLSSQPQSFDLPKCSPLKMPFPTSTLPQEAPLPTISTFKRPFPVQRLNSPEKMSINYAVQSFSLSQAKPQSHSLIVLEDKVLSQDEKIDLTVLGLTEPKMEPSPPDSTFLCPPTFGLPSPEKVIIKEEKQEEVALPAIGATVSTDPNQGLVVVNAMQPKKFIVAPDKLKLSREKIAALAKQIKSQAAQKSHQRKSLPLRDKRIFPTKDSQNQPVENKSSVLNLTETFVASENIVEVPTSQPDENRQTGSKEVVVALPQTEDVPQNIVIQIVEETPVVDLKELPEVQTIQLNNENPNPSEPLEAIVEPLNSGEVQTTQSENKTPRPSEPMQIDVEVPINTLEEITAHDNNQKQISTEPILIDVDQPLDLPKDETDQSNKENPNASKPMQTNVENSPLASPPEMPIIKTNNDNPNPSEPIQTEPLNLPKNETIQSDIEKPSSPKPIQTNVEERLEMSVKKPPVSTVVDSDTDLPKPESSSIVNVIESTGIEEQKESLPLEPSVDKSIVDDEQPSTSKNCRPSLISRKQAAVCVLDETPSSDEISAVDFLAAFAFNTNSNLELSADELNLNASLAMNLPSIELTCSPLASSASVPVQESSPKKDPSVKPIRADHRNVVKAVEETSDSIDATKLLAQMFGDSKMDSSPENEISNSSSIIARELAIVSNTGKKTFLEVDKRQVGTKTDEIPVETKGNIAPVEKKVNVVSVEKKTNEKPIEKESIEIPAEKEKIDAPVVKERNEILAEMETNDVPAKRKDITAQKEVEHDDNRCKEKLHDSLSNKDIVEENTEKVKDPKFSNQILKKDYDKEELRTQEELKTTKSPLNSDLIENKKIDSGKLSIEEPKEPVEESEENKQSKQNEVVKSEGKPTVSEVANSTKRLPRFKKGKINLVQRRKQSIASASEINSDKTKTTASPVESTTETKSSEIPEASEIPESSKNLKNILEKENVQDEASETAKISQVISEDTQGKTGEPSVDHQENVKKTNQNKSELILVGTEKKADETSVGSQENVGKFNINTSNVKLDDIGRKDDNSSVDQEDNMKECTTNASEVILVDIERKTDEPSVFHVEKNTKNTPEVNSHVTERKTDDDSEVILVDTERKADEPSVASQDNVAASNTNTFNVKLDDIERKDEDPSVDDEENLKETNQNKSEVNITSVANERKAEEPSVVNAEEKTTTSSEVNLDDIERKTDENSSVGIQENLMENTTNTPEVKLDDTERKAEEPSVVKKKSTNSSEVHLDDSQRIEVEPSLVRGEDVEETIKDSNMIYLTSTSVDVEPQVAKQIPPFLKSLTPRRQAKTKVPTKSEESKEKGTPVAPSISLINPPKDDEERPLEPAKNPFKRKSLETKTNEENVVGIKSLLKQIDANTLEKDAEVEVISKEEGPNVKTRNGTIQKITDKNNSTEQKKDEEKESDQIEAESKQSSRRKSTRRSVEIKDEVTKRETRQSSSKEKSSTKNQFEKSQKNQVEKSTRNQVEKSQKKAESSENNNVEIKTETRQTRRSKSRTVERELAMNSKNSKVEEENKTIALETMSPITDKDLVDKSESSASKDDSKQKSAIVNNESKPEKSDITKSKPPAAKKPRLESKHSVDTQSDLDITDVDCSNMESYDDTAKEESSQELMATKPSRKRLRKTVDGFKTRRILSTESDSEEDDNRSVANEDSNEFLGFDEVAEKPKKLEENLKILNATTRVEEENANGKKEKKSTITQEKISLEKLFPSKIEKKAPRCGRAVTMPLKKRWELAHKPQEETDITDDTSPVDDDDEDDALPKADLKTLIGKGKSNTHESKASARKRKLNSTNSEGDKREAKKTKLSKEALSQEVKEKAPSPKKEKISPNPPDHVFVEPQPVSTPKVNGLPCDSETPQVKEEPHPSPEKKDSKNDACHSDASTAVDDHEEEEINVSLSRRKSRKARSLFDESVSSSTPIQTTPSCDADLKTATTAAPDTTPVSRKRGRRSTKIEALDETPISEAPEDSTAELDQTPTTPAPKKRGRKPKTLNESANDSPASKSITELFTPNTTIDESATEDVSITSESGPKRRGRKPKYAYTPGALPGEDKINPRLLLIRSRDQLDSDEKLTESSEKPSGGCIQCGLCLAYTTKAKWILHLGEHYGVGWVQGQKELDTTSRSIVLSVMINYYKQTKVKGLNCRMCQRLYRSGLGLLSHIEVCGQTAEEQQKNRLDCEYCKNSYTKLSLPVHVRTCPVRLASIQESVETNAETKTTATEVLNSVGRVKRASLIQAESKLKAIGEAIKEEFNAADHLKFVPPHNMESNRATFLQDVEKFGKIFCTQRVCKFFCTDVEAMEAHLDDCKHIPKPGYHCTTCNKPSAIFSTEERALKHIHRNHKTNGNDFEGDSSECDLNSDSESSDDDVSSGVDSNEDEIEAEEGSKKKSKKRRHASVKHGKFRSGKQLFPPRTVNMKENVARKWKQFISQNYSTEMLFAYATPTYNLHQNMDDNLEVCLPRQQESMKFAFNNSTSISKSFGTAETEVEWNQLQRFETTQRSQSELYSFIGAPVKAIVWAPLAKSSNPEQFLVVAYRRDLDKYSRSLSPKVAPTLLVVYKVNLDSEEKMSLHYAIRVPEGPVHCMEFMPSGGYDEDSNRLGLLAVGTVRSDIRIYSLPLQICSDSKISEQINIVDLDPALTLTLDLNSLNQTEDNVTEPQCMALKWSEYRDHNYIFAGFSNGYVGIWDISENENLNRFVVNGMRHFVPTTYFFCGERCVRSMAVHYDSLGPRWLAVSTLARKINFYDVRDLGNPLIVREETPKNIIQSMEWPVMWEPVAMGMGDAIMNYGECVNLKNPMNVNYNNSKVENMISGVNQVKYNPWQHVFASATENGDLLFNGGGELHYDVKAARNKGKPKVISTMDVKCLNGSPLPKRSDKKTVTESTGVYEDDYKEKYGLVFGPLVKFKDENTPAVKSKERLPPQNIIRYTRINALSCNLNPNGRHLVACGYDNGFLRILTFNRSEYFH